jgi:hypothetical protein
MQAPEDRILVRLHVAAGPQIEGSEHRVAIPFAERRTDITLEAQPCVSGRLAMAGTRFPGSAFVVVPACGDADLVLSDLIHQAVLVGDAP